MVTDPIADQRVILGGDEIAGLHEYSGLSIVADPYERQFAAGLPEENPA